MAYQATGPIHAITEAKQVTERLLKREIVLELGADTGYPQIVAFEFVNDRCPMLDGFEPGEEVRVDFTLRGREWTNPQGEVRYFVNLSGLRVERATGGNGGNGGGPPQGDTPF